MGLFTLIPHYGLLTWLGVILPGALVAYWALWIVYAKTLHPLAAIPGPFWASISRAWYVKQILSGDVEKTQRHLHAQHGPLVRIAPNEIACADASAIKTLYRTQNPLRKTDWYSVWGNASNTSKHPDVFSVQDEGVHSTRRRIVNHVYSLSNVLKSENFIDDCSVLFCQRLGEYADASKEFNLGEWLQWYAFDVLGELFYSEQFGFMRKSEDHDSWIKSLDTLMPPLVITGVSASYVRPLILCSAITIPAARQALKALEHISKAAKRCVSDRAKRYEDSGQAPRQDLLQQFFDIKREKGEKVDFGTPEIELEAYVGLFAGSDTTAIALRATFYFLMKHPKFMKDVQDELDAAAAKGELSNPVQFAETNKLPLVCASIKEAMRLYPSVQFTMPRHAPKGGLEVAGTYIPEGYRVGMNPAVIHYDKSIFGEDADQFRPHRWLEGNAANMEKYMLHFGAGTRTCIGKNISLAELHKLVPTVLRNFDISMAHNDPWTTNNLWFNKQTNLKIFATRRH